MQQAPSGAGALVLGAFLLLPAPGQPSGTRGPAGEDRPYQALATRWLERNHETEAVPEGGWTALLERRFARLALGAFDVYLPPSALAEERPARDAAAALLALLEAQEGWAAWVAGSPPAPLARGRKATPLARWLLGLGPRTLGKREGAGLDLAVLADEATRAELEDLRRERRRGASLGVERELSGVRLVLFPERAEFVEFVCVAGALDERLAPGARDAGLAAWLEFRAGDTRFFTLQHQAAAESGLHERGISVGERNPAAVGELAAQVATRALLDGLYGGAFDPALAAGMANALVIDLYGELDTRIDGDVRARSSQGTSIFVPGGNPDGGALPATSAENRWRGTRGKDHFVGVLAAVQARSGKKAATRPEKLARFELESDDGSRRACVSAPFLGPAAVRPAADLWPDYLELVRCYGVAFLHWLRLAGADDPAASAARFGELLRLLGRPGRPAELQRVIRELYGQPLSAGSAEELFAGPTLEGRFLAWLDRQG